jgi:hypothetical protein
MTIVDEDGPVPSGTGPRSAERSSLLLIAAGGRGDSGPTPQSDELDRGELAPDANRSLRGQCSTAATPARGSPPDTHGPGIGRLSPDRKADTPASEFLAAAYFRVLNTTHEAQPLIRGEFKHDSVTITRIPGQHKRAQRGYFDALPGSTTDTALAPVERRAPAGLRNHRDLRSCDCGPSGHTANGSLL